MTKIYGQSDDNIYFEGDVSGQVDCFGTNDREKGVLIACSDGTILEVKYCKNVSGVWGIAVLNKGMLFDRFEPCTDPDADIYSDIVYLKDGVKFAYAANNNWGIVN